MPPYQGQVQLATPLYYAGPLMRSNRNYGNNPDYALDKHYILGKDIDLMDSGPSSIGGPCGTSDAFTGSFDGKGYTISNIGFTSAAKDIYVKNLFSCSRFR